MKKLLSKYLRWRTERIWYLYLNKDITIEERDEMLFKYQTIKAKWVRGECHHLCAFCVYKRECWTEAKEWPDLEMRKVHSIMSKVYKHIK